jgi:predicted alpha-1,6-mannanase (GH76 family)
LPTRTHVFRNIAVVIVSLLTASIEIMFGRAQPAVDPVHAESDYRFYADVGMAALQHMYQPSTGQWETALWWQQANVLETTIDYTSQTHVTTYIDRIATTFNANKAHSFIINTYYDDEGWWALAWIKAYDLTHTADYLMMAKTLFNEMATGWDSTCGGGLWWSKEKTYKNAVSNELFLEVALRLHQRTPSDMVGGGGSAYNTSYIDWANREWQWFKSSGMLNSSNLINDGLDTSTCKNNGDPTWTYNQGVILGALTDFYQITHDTSYLTQAEAIADANTVTNVDDQGILYEQNCEATESCGDDGPQFKGIFIKNLYYLYQSDHKQAYKDFILKNADSIWSHNRDHWNQLGLHWNGPFDKPRVSSQSAAQDVLNAALN